MPGNGKRLVSKLKKTKNVSPQKFPKPMKTQRTLKKLSEYKIGEGPDYSQ